MSKAKLTNQNITFRTLTKKYDSFGQLQFETFISRVRATLK